VTAKKPKSGVEITAARRAVIKGSPHRLANPGHGHPDSGEIVFFSLSHKGSDVSYCEIRRGGQRWTAAPHRRDQRRPGMQRVRRSLCLAMRDTFVFVRQAVLCIASTHVNLLFCCRPGAGQSAHDQGGGFDDDDGWVKTENVVITVQRGVGRSMDRQAWLAERRAAVVAVYDAEAPAYDEHEYPSDLQQEWVARALRLVSAGGIVLDAPCGTGKYFPMVAAAGHQVVGADQSAGMLAQARARGIAFQLEQVALQDLSYVREFDAVLTVDAMENIPPEDWPLVLANLHRAARPGAVMYLTVEEVEQAEIDQAFQSLSARGLPAVRGEIVEGDVAGYHYYPGRFQAVEWFGREGLAILDEGFRREDGWGYRHFLLRADR
jgi:SAM-dependent methyltransferase